VFVQKKRKENCE